MTALDWQAFIASMMVWYSCNQSINMWNSCNQSINNPASNSIATTPYTTKELCGSEANDWCYTADIHPKVGESMSHSVAVANEHQDEDTYFHIQYTTNDNRRRIR